ncbi:alpha/beta hydrolase [soil metagenome]
MASLFSKDQGSGPTLIFLHGFCETHKIWTDFTHPFADSFRVISPDLPGFGNSEMLQPPFTIDQVGESVANLLIQNEINGAVIIGHSLGGYVGLSLLQNYPQLVQGLVLFHSSVFADAPEKKENRNKIIEFVKKNGVQPFIDTFVPGLFFSKENDGIKQLHDIASTTTKDVLVNYTIAMRDRPDRSSVWSESAIPKLLIAGKEDTSVPIELSRKMSITGRNLKVLELNETAHMGFFEAKSECELIIKRFTYELF